MKYNSLAPLRSISPIRLAFSAISIGFSIVLALAAFGSPVTTSWTYQGQLRRSGTAYTGTCNMDFSLWDAASAGTQHAGTFSLIGVNVTNGLFTVSLDFGDQFKGDALWLATSVQCSGDSGFTQLNPRQPITATPYAQSLRPGATITGVGSLTVTNTQVGGHSVIGSSNGGRGVYGYGVGANSAGVYGEDSTNAAIWGHSEGVGVSIYGENLGTGLAGRFVGPVNVEGLLNVTGSSVGVQLTSTNTSSNGAGVKGVGVVGVYGLTNASAGYGVAGEASAANSVGVYGVNTLGTAVLGDGVIGVSGRPNGTNGTGVFGDARTVTTGYGVVGRGDTGVYGETSTTTGSGVWGASTSSGPAIYGLNTGAGLAGRFVGPVSIQGTLTKSAGSFQIDHPLDPEHKFLSHSFVESPEMMNIYNGNVTTDATGSAIVTLPAYFSALNRDFRYQLTVLGQFAQAIVARKIIADNTFQIRTDKPGVEVSWLVTGVRQDAYAKENPIVVEQAKSAEEDGQYLYPAGFGAGEEKRIGHSNGPAPKPGAPDRLSPEQGEPARK